jgi:phytanoyl-CoA hydroxylase
LGDSLTKVFEKDGYLVLNNLFAQEEVNVLKTEIKKILEEVKQEKGNEATTNGVYVGLSARSEMCKRYAADKRIVDGLKQVMGENIRFLSDKVVFKNADNDFGSPWHQDWPYWKGDHKFSVWIALDDATPENGCLKVIPGSHLKEFVAHTGVAKDGIGFDHRFREEDIDESEAISLSVEAGAAVFFHDLLIHSSHRNSSGKDRWALINTYDKGLGGDPEYDWAVAAFQISGSTD